MQTPTALTPTGICRYIWLRWERVFSRLLTLVCVPPHRRVSCLYPPCETVDWWVAGLATSEELPPGDEGGDEFESKLASDRRQSYQARLGDAGRAVVVAALLQAGSGKPVQPALFDDRRKNLNKSQKDLMDLQSIFSASLQSVVTPVVIAHLPASASDLLTRKNLAGITPLHVVAGGEFGGCGFPSTPSSFTS